jgi:hypothetical protein
MREPVAVRAVIVGLTSLLVASYVALWALSSHWPIGQQP